MPSIFGPLIAPWNVEQAVIATLRTRLPVYLAEIERQNGMKDGELPRPPADDSIYGGTSHDSWDQDQTPAVIVVCNPTGQTEYQATPGYGQMYEVEPGCVVIGQDEDQSRMRAGLYAAAVMGALSQQGDLGGIADETRLISAPSVRFPNPEEMRLAYGLCTFHVWVAQILDRNGGPTVLPVPPDAEPLPVPTVSETETDFTAEGLS